jgi:uncharacterized membrane protein YhaH (DUF805 family)
MSLVQFLFSFEGRVRRLHVWVFFLVLSFIYGGLFWQFGTFHVTHGDTNYGPFSAWTGMITNPIVDIFGIVAVWMKLAVLVKRWHDRGKSGWWVLISLIPIIGWIWQFVECGLLDGTHGSNTYGPSPKGIGAPAAAF